MKDIINNIFKKIKDSGNTQIDLSYLKDNSWFHVNNEVLKSKTVFIFRGGGQLLISKDGDITKASWENLIHSTNSLILDINDKPVLYNIIYLTTEYLVIQKDGTEVIEVFIKQDRYDNRLPKNYSENPINLIYDDLKSLLNQKNTEWAEAISGTKQISSNRAIETKGQLPLGGLSNLIRVTLNATLKEAKPIDNSFKVFNKLEILKEISNQHYLTKDDEVNFFLEMEEIEEILIDKIILCPDCKSLYSITNKKCFVCQSNNILTNEDDNTIIEDSFLKYEKISYTPKREHLLHGKYGYVDENGTLIIEYKFQKAFTFCEGYAVVKLDGKFGFSDKEGTVVIPCQYDDAFGFSEGLARVFKNDRWGYIDRKGKTVIEFIYEGCSCFSGGTASAWIGNVQYTIDRTGNQISSKRILF